MVEDVVELERLADANMATSWAHLASASGGKVGASDRCTLVATGLPAAFFNGGFVTGRVADPDRVIGDAVAFMAEQQVPWLLWVRDGVDDALLEAGRRVGLTDAGGPPAMALPSIPSSPPAPDGLVITVVADESGLEIVRDVAARGFEMPVEFVERLFAESLLADPSMTIILGSVDGMPVSCALASVTADTAGIYNVATPAEHRRRGYGTAVTWAAIAAGAAMGCRTAVLQASELGAPVYRSMGFVDVGRYVQLEGPPANSRPPTRATRG